MHLLNPNQLDIDLLDKRILEVNDFEIEIEKRQVEMLVDSYEARNTRMLIDVNTGEDDIVQTNNESTLKEKKRLQEKIEHVKETIVALKQRKIEAKKKFEFFSAPKRAKAKQKQEQHKDKRVSNKFVVSLKR